MRCVLFANQRWIIVIVIAILGLSLPARAQILIGYSENQQSQPNPSRSPKQYTAPLRPQSTSDDSNPVDIQADVMNYNEEKRVVWAQGNVYLIQGERVVRADQVSYELDNDIVRATGNVVLVEENGDVHTFEKVLLKDQFKEAVAREMQSQLSDGSRISSESSYRIAEQQTVMKDASYTACEICQDNPSAAPAWQIRANKVKRDEVSKMVEYQHAWLEAYGLPVAYFPYFAHPDGTLEQKSGFLQPDIGYKSDEGVMLDSRYYIGKSASEDGIIGLRAFSKETPLLYGEWRKRWNNASVLVNAGMTQSDYTDYIGETSTEKEDEVRGHITADVLWNMNDKWRSGANINWASDDEYMDEYDFTSEDVLENEVYVERFSNRDYSSARLLTFQDTRRLDDPVDQPEIMPEITTSFISDPGALDLIGGTWGINASYLGLRRDGDDQQDMDRLSIEGNWGRHLISNSGLVTDITLSARNDVYHVRDQETSEVGISSEASEVRFFPQAHLVSSYPMVKNTDNYQVKIEPIVGVTVAPNIDVTDRIPNEDSQDVQLSEDSLFSMNRFPGIDRVEDQSRMTYGLRTGVYGAENGEIEAFVGQSYRLDSDDSPFPDGSGLSERSSDVVGSIDSRYKGHRVNYTTQLGSRHLRSTRHELNTSSDFGRFSLATQYLFVKRLEGTSFDESREQAKLSSGYYITPELQINGSVIKEFGGEDEGTRRASLGLTHYGQCVSWGVIADRNYTDDDSDSDFEFLFRLGLKNIGEFERSRWHN